MWFQRLTRIQQAIVMFLAAMLVFVVFRMIVTGRADDFLEAILGRMIGLVIGFTLHEWAHAQVAFRLGGYRALPDPSRLSISPLVHLEPLGIVLGLLAGFGWAKPVPVNPSAFYPNERRDMMTVAFAGPFMNLIVAFVLGTLLQIFLLVISFKGRVDSSGMFAMIYGGDALLSFMIGVWAMAIFFNVLLFFFNLIPLAPLDGWKILLGIVPSEWADRLTPLEPQSHMLLFLLILFGFVGPSIIFAFIGPPIGIVFSLFVSWLI